MNEIELENGVSQGLESWRRLSDVELYKTNKSLQERNNSGSVVVATSDSLQFPITPDGQARERQVHFAMTLAVGMIVVDRVRSNDNLESRAGTVETQSYDSGGNLASIGICFVRVRPLWFTEEDYMRDRNRIIEQTNKILKEFDKPILPEYNL